MTIQDKHNVVNGQFVSERVSQVVQAIYDYCPELEVQWIPPAARSAGENAFRIIHFPEDGEPYTVFHVKSEDEFDARVLKKLIAGDQRNGKVEYSEVLAAEEAAKRVAKARYEDQQAEAIDMMYSVFKSPLNTYRLDKNTVIKENIPFNAKDY